ncbi:aminodeoxychorismate lyase [Alteromonas gilva]|uniref:Aminodeoxychorismate lyase n=1 Tax=Alteromonas gilva TaxID=2987522 RepID=A0ABT5L427_9ALTE|nr:aminodeoxychorismate lyase [Alteromonas gilva]MDC8831266.1 aminodeoxychorismate lyase [Alteromonas gilva]
MTDTNALATLQQFALNDRLANYGDGVFSTMSVIGGRVALFERHIARLHHDAAKLGLTVSGGALRSLLRNTLAAHRDTTNAVLKCLLGAGVGGRGYARAEAAAPCVALSWHQVPSFYNAWQHQGIHLGTVEVNLAQQPLLAGLKHANRLEQVLIKRALAQTTFDDCVVTDTAGNVIEASAANLFWLDNGKWHTPALQYAGVNGVMRQFILDQLPAVEVGQYGHDAVYRADAAFVCNALMQIVPVRQFSLENHTVQYSLTPVVQLRQSLAAAYEREYSAP